MRRELHVSIVAIRKSPALLGIRGVTCFDKIVILVLILSSCHGPKDTLCSDIFEGLGLP